MNAIRPLLVLIAATIIATLTPTPGAHAADAAPRILIAGDSITQGYSGDYTWRYFLDRSLRDAGTAFDFVGPRTSTFRVEADGGWNWHYNGSDAYADRVFDQDHASYWGSSLDEQGFLYESGEQLARGSSPDVMVGAFGANDLLNVNAEGLLARYDRWIAGARSVDADIDFVIAALPWTWRSPEVDRFNSMIDAWAGAQATSTSRIVVARMTEAYSQADTRDGIHPNVVGYRKIARMMGAALGQLGIAAAPVNEPAPVAQPVVPAPAAVASTQPVASQPVTAAPTCKTVRETFKAGVAKSRKAAKRQVKSGFAKPAVRGAAYSQYASLDTDRDGTACERR